MFASVVILLHWHKIHVPNTDYEVSEFNVTLELRADELMILCEILQRDGALVFELVVRAVQRREEVQKLETGLFDCFEICSYFRVSCWVKLGFDLIKYKNAVLICIERLVSFSNQSCSNWVEFSN